jgi:type 1 fimbria pilin
MKKMIFRGIVSISFFALAAVSANALAEDTIEFNGNTVSCTNKCVISGGQVKDCCGGRVRIVLAPKG